jgi:hypothetical protein
LSFDAKARSILNAFDFSRGAKIDKQTVFSIPIRGELQTADSGTNRCFFNSDRGEITNSQVLNRSNLGCGGLNAISG